MEQKIETKAEETKEDVKDKTEESSKEAKKEYVTILGRKFEKVKNFKAVHGFDLPKGK